MRKIIVFIMLLAANAGAPSSFASDDSGTFRGKWWNYYDRGVAYSEKDDSSNAIADLKKAASMRGKDQRMARTYGMHFIDYFPHRELGIAYLNSDDTDNAVKELEESVRNTESARAAYYLNKARKARLMKQAGRKFSPPVVLISSPLKDSAVKDFSVTVKGKVSGEGFISGILINNMPYRFDLARETIEFEKEVSVSDGENSITIRCEDLLGNVSEKTVSVTVDREGPAINIFDMVPEAIGNEKLVKITGEVSDSTGIRQVLLNDKVTKVDNLKAYEFSISVPIKNLHDNTGTMGRAGKFLIQSTDSLENETRAEVDIDSELLAFSKKPEPVLLAFNSSRIFSFDKEHPVVKLKDAADLPAVFVDRYYVEGEAFDNKGIEKIVIGKGEMSTKKGRKIFFSKLVKLSEGNNRISVNAFDSSGNKGAAEFTVVRNVPDVLQSGSRMSLTVLPFDSKKTSDYVQLAYEHLIGSFVDQRRFNVIERAKLEQVLLEQKLTKAKLTDPEHSIKIGKLMSANAVLATSVKEGQKSIEVISRVINTETSEVMEVRDVFTEDKGLSSVKELMDGLAAKVASAFPVVEGMVIKKDQGLVYSDIGDKAGIRKDAGIIIFRRGKEIKHPVTGKSLGWDTVKLGEGRIEDIQEDFSKIKISDKPASQEIKAKDLVITK